MYFPDRRRILRKLAVTLLASATPVALSGCGTILHPERRGQPAGRIDWKIAALNGLGLLLFFVPGVIAFAVDFNNGTIYLPPDGQASAKNFGALDAADLRTVSLPVRRPEVPEIERVLRDEAGVVVNLSEERVQWVPLESLRDFRAAMQQLLRSPFSRARELQQE